MLVKDLLYSLYARAMAKDPYEYRARIFKRLRSPGRIDFASLCIA